MSEPFAPGGAASGVLVVDPAPAARSQLKHSLEACGWRVWTAADAPSALHLYAARRAEIGAVVVDLHLPGLQGARVLAELGSMCPALVRVATSGDLPGRATAAFRRLSALPLFEKPVRVEDVDHLLRRSLSPE
ncbi:response regulator [Limnoglobus roseus]|uniref:Response regulator n=1 Tax=Limnoglobus roseus TaxID=2598579 RepID=A0A5C1AED1_9BACT|nr:response regulator [Limnoglobus roseus]QEL17749.1 response regulator [Limnoglobus roseus]